MRYIGETSVDRGNRVEIERHERRDKEKEIIKESSTREKRRRIGGVD